MDVSHTVVVLSTSGPNFVPADEDVLELALLVLALDGRDDFVGVLVRLHVDSGVPLAVFMLVADALVAGHGKLHNELLLLCQALLLWTLLLIF